MTERKFYDTDGKIVETYSVNGILNGPYMKYYKDYIEEGSYYNNLKEGAYRLNYLDHNLDYHL